MELISATDLRKVYQSGTQTVNALDGLSFSLDAGQFAVILGPSGSGKSTLFNMLGGIDSPSSGELIFNGRNLSRLSNKEIDKYRKNDIGLIFQNYNLLPDLTVVENIKLVADLCQTHLPIDDVLNELGIVELKNRFPHELSGGQQQRVAVARAIIKKPLLLLCDEPTASLDSQNSLQVLGLLQECCIKFGTTIFLITHNREISRIADIVFHICDGKMQDFAKNTTRVSLDQLNWRV